MYFVKADADPLWARLISLEIINGIACSKYPIMILLKSPKRCLYRVSKTDFIVFERCMAAILRGMRKGS